jgi:hypothetical protein
MPSLLIKIMRENYPGESDAESARAYAQEHGYIAIVRYKSNGAPDFTHVGVCRTESEIRNYLTSPYCCDAEVIYDGRPTAQSNQRSDVAGTQYDLIVVICEIAPADKNAFLVSLLDHFHVPLGTNAQGVVYQHPDARTLDKVFPNAIAYGLTLLRQRSLELDDGSVKVQQFELPQGSIRIGGYVFMMCGKR